MGAHHVKNKDLREEIILCKEKDELSSTALDMFMLMADRFSNKLTYVYPEDKQDCIQSAVLDCYLYWRSYDPEKSENAFAYYTQIIKNGFAKGWRKLYGNMPKSSKISISQHQLYNL
jgi:DNA-directed RNA polymerase specialized sigma subunit